MSNHFQNKQADSHKIQNFVKNGEASIKIKMEPKSLSMTVPLSWQVNKIKCILCSVIPKLQFNMINLTHDDQILPGNLTLQEVFDLDNDEQCQLKNQYVLNFQKNQERPLQFQKYYASKMIPLLSSIKQSPYQPLLHPKYYALQSQILQLSEMSGQNIKVNLQSLLNLRTLLNNIQRNDRNGAPEQPARVQNQANPQNVVGVMGGGNLFGLLPGNNRNVFEWIMFIVFKVFQIMIFWQLLQVVYTYINKWHILIIALIAIFYFYIQYYQKQRNQQLQQRPLQPQQQQQVPQGPLPQQVEVWRQQLDAQRQKIKKQLKEGKVQDKVIEDKIIEESQRKEQKLVNLQNQHQIPLQNQRNLINQQLKESNSNSQKFASQNSQMYQERETNQKNQTQAQNGENRNAAVFKILKFSIEFSCLLGESVIGFLMSLFPNWNIQLHHNILRRPFDYIDSVTQNWVNQIKTGPKNQAQEEEQE